jgi:hypothetical protein
MLNKLLYISFREILLSGKTANHKAVTKEAGFVEEHD